MTEHKTCDWCDEPATHTGTKRQFACREHRGWMDSDDGPLAGPGSVWCEVMRDERWVDAWHLARDCMVNLAEMVCMAHDVNPNQLTEWERGEDPRSAGTLLHQLHMVRRALRGRRLTAAQGDQMLAATALLRRDIEVCSADDRMDRARRALGEVGQ